MARDESKRPDSIGQVEKLLDDASLRRDDAAITEVLASMPSRDLAVVIGRASPEQAAVFLRLLPEDRADSVFESLSPAVQRDVIATLDTEDAATIFQRLDPDDRVRLLDDLAAPLAERLMSSLSAEAHVVTASILAHPVRSVGHAMSPEYVAVGPSDSVAHALARVRAHAHSAETVYVIPVVGDAGRLLGVVSLRDLIAHEPETLVADIVRPAESVRTDVDVEDAARACTESQLLAIPVVDDTARLVGIFTIDDALRALDDAEAEDTARAGASEPLRRPYLPTPILRVARSRVVWLMVLAVSAVLTVQVLGVFEATLEQMVVLALFIPLLTGTGGNAGSQAATTVTRALAVGDVRTGDTWRVLFKEMRVGATLGLVLGATGFVVASLAFGVPLGTVIGLTLLLICTMAAAVGGVMPMLAKSLRADPAVFSTPFITTFCDATGLIIYFTVAKAVLGI